MRKSTFIYSLSLALAFSVSFLTDNAHATKLNAAPLPHERDAKEFTDSDASETIIPPSGSRWDHRHNYREDDKDKKQKDEQAKKDAADNAKKAQQDRVDAYSKALQTSIDANNQAVALGKLGRWEEAIAAHEKAIQYDPRNKQFRVNLSAAHTAFGQERMAKGDLTTAVSQFRKALAAASDNGLAGRCLVQCLKKMGYDPSNPDVRLQLGDQLAATGDMASASVEYTAAMQLEPSARTYIKMGDMAYRYGQVPSASSWYHQAIAKDKDYGPAYRQLGFLEMAQKDFTQAAAHLRTAVILDSKDGSAGQALVDLWRRQVSSSPSTAENHLGLAGALQLTGDFSGAESEYAKVEQIDKSNPGLEAGRASLVRAYQHARAEKHKLAAETLFNQGLRREALSEITQAVTAEPQNANYQYLLGECLEAIGDYQGAHKAYLTCVLIDPENNKEAASRIRQMEQLLQQGASQARTQQSSNRAAQEEYARQSAPSLSRTANNINEGSNAGQAQQTAARPAADAASAGLMDGLSRVTDAEAQKDYNTAISILRDLSSANVQNPEIHHRLAVNLLAAGQIDDSITEFRVSSALCPGKQSYADDLARALAIKKNAAAQPAGAGTPVEHPTVQGALPGDGAANLIAGANAQSAGSLLNGVTGANK